MYIVNGAVLERWSSLTDERIVAHVVAGQTALFELLIRRHNDRLYGAARAVLRDDHDAEDVMQRAYVKAYAHLRLFDGHTRFCHVADRNRCQRGVHPCTPPRPLSRVARGV